MEFTDPVYVAAGPRHGLQLTDEGRATPRQSGTRAAALGKQAVVANHPALRKLAALLGRLEARQLDASSFAGVSDDLNGTAEGKAIILRQRHACLSLPIAVKCVGAYCWC